MSSVANGKIKFVEQNPVRESFGGRNELGVAFRSEGNPHVLNLTQASDGGRVGRDGGGGNLDVFRVVHQVLPLEIVGADLSIKFVPSGGDHHFDTSETVLEGFQQTTHSGDDPGGFFVDDGVGGEEGKDAWNHRGRHASNRGLHALSARHFGRKGAGSGKQIAHDECEQRSFRHHGSRTLMVSMAVLVFANSVREKSL